MFKLIQIFRQPTTSGVSRHLPALQSRFQSNGPKPAAGRHTIKMDKPSYHLSFTCKKCGERSGHVISKQAYHGGSVLVQCPGCNVRHLIADHLKIFSDKKVTIEDILADQGEKVGKGLLDGAAARVGENGDVEIEPVVKEVEGEKK